MEGTEAHGTDLFERNDPPRAVDADPPLCEYCAQPERGILIRDRYCCTIRYWGDAPREAVKEFIRRTRIKDGPEAADRLKADIMARRTRFINIVKNNTDAA